ncbi:alkaline phosphatase [Marmoricola endophyticus]|uniref:Alkaline phosphatase n=1 Tax=Marmoricola endophyticus TaxID=2040280 RepID=A0A917BQN0_9ACTN|nr:alkaline phosphatase D family protein [Marmoricola endophyticus]GGF55383.1 alkaline phosphatase [Marmoricola endophyticus]
MTSREPQLSSTRRTVLRGAGVVAAAGAVSVLGTSAAPADLRPSAATSPLPQTPFTLGVASGDPEPDGFVIWTRLAIRPLAANGRGGMPSQRYDVEWEVATDDRFRRVVRRGTVSAGPESAHAVHVEVTGLGPGREYWYRFRAAGYVSETGRSLSAPSLNKMPTALAMSFVSCSQFEHGWFTAYRGLAEDRPDLILHLGDYQYEYTANAYVADSGNVRDHAGPETTTLAGYRQRYAQYRTDPDLRAAHAVAPWLAVFDDHEVDNNWAGFTPEHPEDQAGFRQRRRDAFRAYYENQPLRRTSVPNGPHIQAYRRRHWGRLATFHVLDTRQFRDDQACDDGYDACPAAYDPKRSITGDTQEKWLLDGFRESSARWDLISQQVFFAQRDSDAGPVTVTSMDAWDGYVGSRDRITRGFVDAGVRNPVVLTGDVHAHWGSDLYDDYAADNPRTVGSELVTSSITSGGDGYDSPTGEHPWFPQNPNLRFWTNLRGYVNTLITPDSMSADYRVVPKVSVKDQPVLTRATYAIEDRSPGLQQVSSTPVPSPMRAATPRSDAQIIKDTIGQAGTV